MIAPLPAPVTYPQQPALHYQYVQPAAPPASISHDRWDNMATLFESVRGYARTYEYPSATVAALETVLIRLYLESPVTTAPQTVLQPGPPVVDPNIQPNLGESSSASGQGSPDEEG